MKVAEAVQHMTKAYVAKENDVFERVTAFEQQVLADADDPDSLKYEDDEALDVLQAVLDVALEDQRVSTLSFPPRHSCWPTDRWSRERVGAVRDTSRLRGVW